ncbi:hypothetical protein Prudu_003545 [Prunus dulcis]|uniref:Uncharacterized protein n=1 Tax=Prunus dulcis TaxID=3755 RepID=A0A4Y1QTD2_PRUDU|nr:hypothetical protein Prudu_003545 [Prunus dulcis]
MGRSLGIASSVRPRLVDGDLVTSHTDKISKFFNFTMEDGICLMAVLSASRVFNDIMSPKPSAKFSNLEQPLSRRVSIDLEL